MQSFLRRVYALNLTPAFPDDLLALYAGWLRPTTRLESILKVIGWTAGIVSTVPLFWTAAFFEGLSAT